MKAAINLLKIALAGAETNQKAPEPYPGYKERDLAPYIKDLREALSLLQQRVTTQEGDEV